jgi:hypothetical protein
LTFGEFIIKLDSSTAGSGRPLDWGGASVELVYYEEISDGNYIPAGG